MKFDIAAVKEDKATPNSDTVHYNVPITTWDFPAGVLRFSIHASCGQYCAGKEKIERSLNYNLQNHTFRATTKP